MPRSSTYQFLEMYAKAFKTIMLKYIVQES